MRLRMINEGDIEDLREWKNENKQSFFLQNDITPEQQAEWYKNFKKNDADYMFMVEQFVDHKWQKIGCEGFRYLSSEECIDGYNIIRSRKLGGASFSMSEAFKTMLAYANSLFPELPIRVKVLSGNPAVRWYERNGFKTVEERDSYFLMEVDKSTLDDVSLTVE
jgi:hypothetical protein